MDAIRLLRGQFIVKDAMQGAYDDDYPDKLDALAVKLEDVYEFNAQEADEIVWSDWWMV